MLQTQHGEDLYQSLSALHLKAVLRPSTLEDRQDNSTPSYQRLQANVASKAPSLQVYIFTDIVKGVASICEPRMVLYVLHSAYPADRPKSLRHLQVEAYNLAWERSERVVSKYV